jgi:alpha-1,3-rhamnosyl/mannosyltransferase
MLRVGVNLLFCSPGRVGGSEQYLVRQLLGLRAVAADPGPHLAVRAYASRRFLDAHRELAGEGFEGVASPVDTDRRPLRVAIEHSWLAVASRGDDLVHHGGGTVPVVGRRPAVLTLHDLQFLSHPEYVAPVKLRYLRSMVRAGVRRAAVVATPTAFVRRTVLDAYDVAPERVVVVPHGVPDPDPDAGARSDPGELRRRYGLGDGPVLVYPAITHPHKDHAMLLDLLERHWRHPDLRLVLLGGRGVAEDDVAARIAGLGAPSRVVRPGRVPDADRDGLLALATALVFPSRYEGFGAPLVEAMTVGTPIVCSDHEAIREVVGDAAVVRPVGDVSAWADALDEVARRRDELVAAGRRRREAFTLAASGRALRAAYELAVTT